MVQIQIHKIHTDVSVNHFRYTTLERRGWWKSWLKEFKTVLADRDVILLGLIQGAAESCMYTFAFTSLRYFTEGNYYSNHNATAMLTHNGSLGMFFAVYMTAWEVGASLFPVMREKGCGATDVLLYALAAMCASMAACTLVAEPDTSLVTLNTAFAAFIVFEVAAGMYHPAMAYARSKVQQQSMKDQIL